MNANFLVFTLIQIFSLTIFAIALYFAYLAALGRIQQMTRSRETVLKRRLLRQTLSLKKLERDFTNLRRIVASGEPLNDSFSTNNFEPNPQKRVENRYVKEFKKQVTIVDSDKKPPAT